MPVAIKTLRLQSARRYQFDFHSEDYVAGCALTALPTTHPITLLRRWIYVRAVPVVALPWRDLATVQSGFSYAGFQCLCCAQNAAFAHRSWGSPEVRQRC